MSSSAPSSADAQYSLYPFGTPNRGAAIFYAVLFLISGIIHSAQVVRFGIARYSFLLPLAAFAYAAAFITRDISSYQTENLTLFIATTVLLYVAPPLYAAGNYIALGRILAYVPSKTPIHPGRVATTFIVLDAVVEVLTGQGGWRIADYADPQAVALGKGLIEASLILQVVLYLLFMTLQVIVYRRCMHDGVHSRKFRYGTRVLFISTSLILGRSIYRVVDSFLGYTGYTESHEWCEYVLDATLLLVNSYMLNIWHPSLFIPPSDRVYLGSDGHTERFGPGWKDERPFLLTVADPFDIAGIFTGRDSKNQYWLKEDQHPQFAPDVATEEDDRSATQPRGVFGVLHLGRLRQLYIERDAQKAWLKSVR